MSKARIQASFAAALGHTTGGKMSKKQNTTSKYLGRCEPSVGDLVTFHTPMQHQLGSTGLVVGWIDKNTVLVKTFGGVDTDFPPLFVSLGVRKPNRHEQNNGHQRWNYSTWVDKVIYSPSGNGKKGKKRKPPVKFFEVTESEVHDVLAGNKVVPEGHQVVIVKPSFSDMSEAVDNALTEALGDAIDAAIAAKEPAQ